MLESVTKTQNIILFDDSIDNIITDFTKNNLISYVSYSIIQNNKTVSRYYSDDKWTNFFVKSNLVSKCPLATSCFNSNESIIIPWNKIQSSSKEGKEILLSRRFFNQNYGCTILIKNKYFSEAFVLSSKSEIDFSKVCSSEVILNLLNNIRLQSLGYKTISNSLKPHFN